MQRTISFSFKECSLLLCFSYCLIQLPKNFFPHSNFIKSCLSRTLETCMWPSLSQTCRSTTNQIQVIIWAIWLDMRVQGVFCLSSKLKVREFVRKGSFFIEWPNDKTCKKFKIICYLNLKVKYKDPYFRSQPCIVSMDSWMHSLFSGWVNTLVGGQKEGARGFMFFIINVDLTEEGLCKDLKCFCVRFGAGQYVFDGLSYISCVSSACWGYHLPHVPVYSEAADRGPSRVGLSGV